MPENSVKRKLRAILSADVKGYSRMMGEDEVGTYQTLTANLESIRPIISEHNGRIFSSPGDAIMAEFSSVVDAVQCAVKLQENIEAANAELPEDRKMQFRIGVNLGDVIYDGEQVYGDGVNIAARIETLAKPGGVSISKTVYNHAHKKLNFGYEYQGEHQVKNIAEPVSVYRVLTAPEHAGQVIGEPKPPKLPSKKSYISILLILALVVAAAIWQFYFRAPKIEAASVEKMAHPLPEKPSIAVLPFDNMSGDPDQDYFSDGITEDIITALSKTPQMFVIARNSTFTYKEKAVKIKQVAEELGVQYVLEGSVQKEGDRVRITAQLIDAIAGHHLWAERYDRDFKDIFALQDEITIKIIGSLRLELTDGQLADLHTKGTENLEAYLKLLQVREPFYTLTKEGNAQARHLAEEAIVIDPEYAAAYVYLAATHYMSITLGSSKFPKESMKRAFEYIRKAIALDDSLPEAYTQLGWLYVLTKQYEKGIAECERAIALAPNSANAHIWMGFALTFAGRHEEAVRYSERALRLDPLPPQWYFRAMGLSYAWVGRYDEAISFLKKSLQRAPSDFVTNTMLTVIYSWAGRIDEANKQASEVLRIMPNYSIERFRKRSFYKNKEDNERYIEGLRKAGLPEKPPLPLPDKPSIAVLPFENMSGDPEQKYFSDGFTEHIITSLSKVPYIFVIARQSSFSFRDKQMTVQQIAKELGVRYILEGSIQRSGERLRITVQLIDATSGHHIWADNYDRNLTDIFALQDEIAMQIMAELQLKVTVEEIGTLSATKTKNIRAYEKFLMGYEHFFRRTEGDSQQAKKLAQEAISLDAEYGAAYKLLANCYLDDVYYYRTKSTAKSLEKAEHLIQKSIDLSGPDATAHHLLCSVHFLRRQYDKAVSECRKSVDMSPNFAESNYRYAQSLRYAGRFDEAITFFKKAIRLNPITPMTYLNNIAWVYTFSEQYEKAISIWNKAIERNPDYFFAYLGLTLAYQLSGNEQKAREAAAEVMRLKPNLTISKLEKGPATKGIDRKRMMGELRKAGIPD